MQFSPADVRSEHEWVRQRAGTVVPLINETRSRLRKHFETDVEAVTVAGYRDAVDDVFADGDLAVNVAALVALLRDLDVEDDYPGFVVDELLGRELAGMIAGTQPLRLLGEATFHFADVATHGDDADAAGVDDLDAALAAGFQTRLPGWHWTRSASPFASRRD